LEEPLVLSTDISLLKQLFDVLLRVLPLTWLLEGISRRTTLETLQLECVSCWEEVGAVHGLQTNRRQPTFAPDRRVVNLVRPLGAFGGAKMTNSHLDKRLDLVPLRHCLLPHSLGHFSGVSLDAGDNGMRVWSLLGALIKLLDDDHLFPCLSPLENDGDL
jgi:hypothetical protein